MNTLTAGTPVKRSGYDGTIICEYLPNMYEVRLNSGVVVVPVEELQVRVRKECSNCGLNSMFSNTNVNMIDYGQVTLTNELRCENCGVAE